VNALEAQKASTSSSKGWNLGVRGRLLLAFFGISAFAVLAAAAGIYASRQVGERLERIDARVPQALSSLEVSRGPIDSLRRLRPCSPQSRQCSPKKYRSECARRSTAWSSDSTR